MIPTQAIRNPTQATAARTVASGPFHIMSKPSGSRCNLDCQYCFYLEKEKLYPSAAAAAKMRMPDAVLEAYVRDYIAAQPGPVVSFAWQGGEPTLMGVEFFRRAVALQKQYANGKKIENAFQTNGTLLNDEWGAFLAKENFLVGISIDGPRHLHDTYRVDRGQRPTFDRVMAGMAVLKKHRVEFNTLTTINRANATHALEVYRFLRKNGSGFMQFIPIVERMPQGGGVKHGLSLSLPPVLAPSIDKKTTTYNNSATLPPAQSNTAKLPQPTGTPDTHSGQQPTGKTPHPQPVANATTDTAQPNQRVTPWSVRPAEFGEFLCTIFDEWVRRDVGRVFIQHFDTALGKWLGAPGGSCVFAETCGRGLALEHNGDVYSCDHYVYPEHRLGNLMDTPLAQLADSPQQQQFGREKQTTLPRYCRECPVRFACNGDCPKHRFATTPDGEPGLSYLCKSYRRFFTHIDRPMRLMADLIRSGQHADAIMPILRRGSIGS